MVKINQLLKNARIKKSKNINSAKLKANPQKRAICLKLLTISPKKPNSANRRVAKVIINHYKTKLTAKINGEGHNLQNHSLILLCGARVRDLIGVSYAAIRGKYDLAGVTNRKSSRSRFGIKKTK
jgi:small subunit ribosomal protein S12